MRKSITQSTAAVMFLLMCATPTFAESPDSPSMDGRKAFSKLTRGFFNTVTGWVEIPKRIHETSYKSGPAAGFTWGVLRGLGYGFIRTAAGLYELVTFPFPAPPNYEPVIQPEYVFTDNSTVMNGQNALSIVA